MNFRGNFLRGLIVILLLQWGFVVFADSDSEADTILQELVSDSDFVVSYIEAMLELRTGVEHEAISNAIEITNRIPSRQVYEILKDRFERLPDIADILEIPELKESIVALLEGFKTVCSQRDRQLLEDFSHWAILTFQDPAIEVQLDQVRTVISERGEQPIELVDLNRGPFQQALSAAGALRDELGSIGLNPAEQNSSVHQAALSQVERFREILESKVVGQQDIVSAFTTLYLKDLLFDGHRRQPELFYFMGLPGNGKDTLAEEYVDALYQTRGAHQDHMFAMNIRSKEEAWSYFGSGKGYVGSSELPAFLKFLVQHSGGKYILAEEQDGLTKRKIIERNPDWRENDGLIINGPHKAVVFVNEAHNIPKEVKDNVLKQAIERGIFPITNPGSSQNSVEKIELPVTFIFASNEGIDLLEPRNRNGTRTGPPLSFEDLIANYHLVAEDKEILKQAILRTNGGVNDVSRPNAPGTSEEFLNRFPDHRIHILRPFSPEERFEVAKRILEARLEELSRARGSLGNYEVQVSDEVIRFIADYNVVPSENARPIKARVESFVLNNILEALKSQRIRPLGETQRIVIGLREYETGVRSLVFQASDLQGENSYQFTRLVRETLREIPRAPLSQERIDEILAMREKITSNVFGVEPIVDRLLEAALVSESEARNSKESSRPATVMAFLGKSSTGKTETAKQYVKARYGEDFKPTVIDFNGVRTIEAMEAKIMGSYDGNKNPIPSDFMKAYDRANGNITFIFDEAANSPKELLKALYEVTREANVTGFSDGKSRPMNNVTIILTGNAGEQIYNNIPEGLPRLVRERAMNEVFQVFLQNEDIRHRILTESFPEALLARLGQNIFHFGPLQDDGKRQIAQLKLEKGLEKLRPTASERGWQVSFESESDLLGLFEMIEHQGFKLDEQGASIDKFVREALMDRIKSRLLKEGVPSGDVVSIELKEDSKTINDRGTRYLFREMVLHHNDREFSIEIPLGVDQPRIGKTDHDRILTAYHEAGHELVSSVYFGDKEKPVYLSIIEGVALIGSTLVPYNGVRKGEVEIESRNNKEVVLREAAILAAGYVAQQLITLGARDDGGKSNDMLRATGLIRNAILRQGLSQRWGVRAIPEGLSNEDYIAKELSTSEKEELNRLTSEWLQVAEDLAREAIWVNMDKLFVHMSKAIAQEGQIYGDQILELYEQYGVLTERDEQRYQEVVEQIYEVTNFIDESIEKVGDRFYQRYTEDNFSWDKAEEAFAFLSRRNSGLVNMFNPLYRSSWESMSDTLKMVVASRLSSHIQYRRRDAQIASDTLLPERVANIEDIIAMERDARTSRVTELERFNIIRSSDTTRGAAESSSMAPEVLTCSRIF